LALEPHFGATIEKAPSRFNPFAGAAQGPTASAKAKDYFQKLRALASTADTARPDLVAAHEFLARN
jgi:hypothetical protein